MLAQIKILDVIGSTTLAGKLRGNADLPKFIAAVQSTPEGSVVVLDWSGTEIVTSSYFGATLLAVLRMAMSGTLDRYFILTNMNAATMDELKLVLDFHGLATLVGTLSRGRIKNISVFGKLDAVHATTFSVVASGPPVSAASLEAHTHEQSKIGRTGWINRLNTLHELRLLRKSKFGRQFLFHIPNQEVEHGRRLDSSSRGEV